MSRLRVGVLLDEFGRPMRALYADEGPSRARKTAHAATTDPAYGGTLVVGRSGAKPSTEVSRAAMAAYYRARQARP